MKLLQLLGKYLSLLIENMALFYSSIFETLEYPVVFLIVLAEDQYLNEQGLLDGMKQVENKGYTARMISSMWLKRICREKVKVSWALEKREEPMPQRIYLVCF